MYEHLRAQWRQAAYRDSDDGSGGEHVLLHRGVGDYSHTDGHRTAEEWWNTTHAPDRFDPEGRGFGKWWDPDKDTARHYSGVDGHTPSGVVVSAHFPAERVRPAQGSTGHLVQPGTPGRVHSVEFYHGQGRWERLPHSPGFHVTA